MSEVVELSAELVTVEEPARDVFEALRRVMRDLPGIGKDMQAAEGQGGYKYRGIEQITGHTQQLFAQHGIVMVPEVLEWTRDEVTVASKPWHDEKCKIIYTIYGPGGRDDTLVVGPLYTIGRDGTDKGINKCMTQALKYALIQVLCIGDKADDADGTTSEAGYHDDVEYVDPLTVDELRRRCARVGLVIHGYPSEWTRLNLPSITNMERMTTNLLGTARAILDATEQSIELNGDVLPPLGDVVVPTKNGAGGPESAADGEVGGEAGEASTDAGGTGVETPVPADGESPAPPAPDLPDVAAMGDAEIIARVQLARVGRDSALLDALAAEAIERGLDVAPPPDELEEPKEAPETALGE